MQLGATRHVDELGRPLHTAKFPFLLAIHTPHARANLL